MTLNHGWTLSRNVTRPLLWEGTQLEKYTETQLWNFSYMKKNQWKKTKQNRSWCCWKLMRLFILNRWYLSCRFEKSIDLWMSEFWWSKKWKLQALRQRKSTLKFPDRAIRSIHTHFDHSISNSTPDHRLDQCTYFFNGFAPGLIRHHIYRWPHHIVMYSP